MKSRPSTPTIGLLLGVSGALIGSLLMGSAPASAASRDAVDDLCGEWGKPLGSVTAFEGTCQWSFQSFVQTWTVPNGVDVITVTADGAAGGLGGGPQGQQPAGGTGAVVTAQVEVDPGDQISLVTGGQGGDGGAGTGGLAGTAGFGGTKYNGGQGGGGAVTGAKGGGGGGATTVEVGTSNLLVAGGGGGGGAVGYVDGTFLCGAFANQGGDGGDAGVPDTKGSAGEDGKTGAPGGLPAAQTNGVGGTGATRGAGCSGGAGGGGGGIRGGGGGKSAPTVKTIGGGGGGAGASRVDEIATTFDYATGGTGNGGVTITYEALHVTRPGVPDARRNRAYSYQLKPTQPATFDLVGGVLPDGLRLTKDGEIAGKARRKGNFSFTIRLVTAAGLVSDQSFTMSVIDGDGIVIDRPATAIQARSAKGHGTVTPNGPGDTEMWCKVSTKASSINDAPRVDAKPGTADGQDPVDFACSFEDLDPGTTYYYRVFARDGFGEVDGSGSSQSFQTELLKDQTAKIKVPASLRKKGKTSVLAGGVRTNTGAKVTVDLDRLGQTKTKAIKLIQSKNGRTVAKTTGKKGKARLTWFAPATAGYQALKVTRTYKLK